MKKYRQLIIVLPTALVFFLIISGCRDAPVDPPANFIDYKPFSLNINETYIYARVDRTDISVTYKGLAISGWAGLEWPGGGGSFNPEYVTGKEIYLNYAVTGANIQFKIKFISIQPDRITLQCMGKHQ